MKIAFLGNPKIAQIVLKKLSTTQYKPDLVITGHDKKSNRGLPLKATDVKIEAQKQGIKISYELNDIDKSFDLAILVAFGKIIPDEILSRPKFGFVNLHPSLLPKYRGPSPIYSAILNGDKKTGITIIKLDSELDHGPILAQETLKIQKSDTHQSLIEKAATLGADTLVEILPAYLDGSLKPIAQNHSKATYTEKITRESGKININKPPNPETLSRMVHAYYPWPGVWFQENGKRFKLLPKNKIQPEGKKPMATLEFANGYPNLAEKLKSVLF